MEGEKPAKRTGRRVRQPSTTPSGEGVGPRRPAGPGQAERCQAHDWHRSSEVLEEERRGEAWSLCGAVVSAAPTGRLWPRRLRAARAVSSPAPRPLVPRPLFLSLSSQARPSVPSWRRQGDLISGQSWPWRKNVFKQQHVDLCCREKTRRGCSWSL